MINSNEPIVWKNSQVLKVTGTTARPGIVTSREGFKADITPDLLEKVFSHSSSMLPSFLTHDDREICGYNYKLGYDRLTDEIKYEGFIFDPVRAERVLSNGYDMVSPEIEWDIDSTGKPVDGRITGVAFVRNPAMSGTKTNKQLVAFSTPSHPWEYGKSDKAWSKPALESFTSSSWEELTTSEKRSIAGSYAYSLNMPPEKFGDMKFPHHDPKSHAVVWAAVANGMARLNQSGLSDIDKKAVFRHLASHYKEFNKEPPKMYEDGKIMESVSYSMTTNPDGTYSFMPSQTTSGTATSTVPTINNVTVGYSEVDVKKIKTEYESKIADLEAKIAKYEGDLAQATNQTQVMASQVAAQSQVAVDYKQKYDAIVGERVTGVIGELKSLGIKDPDAIGRGLDVEQRLNILQSVKENLVKTNPVTASPSDMIGNTIVPTESKEAKIKNIMQQNGIDLSNIKYVKVN